MSDPPAPDPDAPSADERDPAIADLVGRIRRADDPTAALLRPLSDEARRAMAAEVIASMGAVKKVAPTRRRARWIAPVGAAIAMAAAVALWVTRAPELPAYRVEMEGDALVRGADAGAEVIARLRPETKLRVRLAPSAPARDAALRLVVVREGKAIVISPPAMSDGRGGFTIEEAAGRLLGEQVDGPIELVFAIGRPLPDDDRLAAIALDRAARPPASTRIERRAAVLVGFSPKQGKLGFSGCKGVRAGPVCEVGRGTPVHVWAEGRDASRFTLRIDDREAAAIPVEIEGGLRWSVEPPRGAARMTLSLAGREVLRVPLEDAIDAPIVDAADELRKRGRLGEAEAKLDEAPRDLASIRLRARIAHKRGDLRRAAELREEAIARGRAEGRTSAEIDDRLARVFDLLYAENALGEAKARLDALPEIDENDGEDRVKIDYYRGLLAGEVGDLSAAIAALSRARIDARRFAVGTYEAGAAAPLADALSGLGRYDEAAVVLAEMERSLGAVDACQRAALVMDRGAVLLRAGRIDDAGARLDEARRLADPACPRVLRDVITNLAFHRREAGATEEARALLAQARADRTGADAWMEVWHERLAIELAIASDPRAAIASAEKVRRAAEASLSPELAFEAEMGRARALDRMGDTAAAARAYASAERALDAWGALVPLGEGRSAFFARQDRAARAWIDFLHREAARPGAGPEAAIALARAARRSVGRFHRALGESDRAGARASIVAGYHAARARIDAAIAASKAPLPDDLATVRAAQSGAASAPAEPVSPREGEVALVFHPIAEGLLGLAWSAREVIVRALGAVDPAAGEAALRARLIEPFRDVLARATKVRIHAHRALDRAPLHTLVGGVPTVVGVDLGAAPPVSACGGRPAAVIVADARLDLAAASAVSSALEASLAARGFEVRRLQGDAARVDAVRAALVDPCVMLFHYEGHAVFQGRDGLDAALLLADGRLRAADILALPRVPDACVLSGCSTGEADGLGLAHAFLARGALEVLATTRPVRDATAALVGDRLYAPASPGGAIPPRLAEGWSHAFEALRGAIAAPADLDAYRVLAR